jgi:hypothetical protein
MKYTIIGEIEAKDEEEARFAATIEGGHDYLRFIEEDSLPPNDCQIIEVSRDMAQYLFNCGKEVYRIHNHFDSSAESLCAKLEDILNFDGIFFVEVKS